MHLKLSLGGTVIASVPLNEKKASNLEYIYTKRCLLIEACSSIVAGQQESPVYYIEVASRMNNAVKE